jgi:DNA transformation protein
MDGLRHRAMFGGHGLYRGGTFFGIVYRGRLYLRTTPATRPRYTEHGMGPFRPNEKQTLWDYYEVPASVFQDDAELLAWVEQSADGAEVR